MTRETLIDAFRENLQASKAALKRCADREDWTGVATCARAVSYWRRKGRETMSKIILSADTGADMTEAEFDAWVAYVDARIDERCGFPVTVEGSDYGTAHATKILASNEAREATIREAAEALWEDWCSGGGVAVGDRVEAGKCGTEDHDTGEVLSIEGDMALVAWEGSGDKSEIRVDGLSKVAS